jgi:uncharacterized protein
MKDAAQPTSERERIVALDVLRGFALLGILIMNIQAFSMPSAAYTNPAAFGDLTGANAAVWAVSHVVADQKFMTIFSMLFGAGICLFSERAKTRTGRPAKFFYRRTLVLLLVGLLHAYLLFFGEILTHYALCALWVYLLRNKSVTTLVVIAGVLLLVPTAIEVAMTVVVLPHMPPEALQKMGNAWAPPPHEIAAYVEGMRGSFTDQLAVRAKSAVVLQTLVFALYFGWRITANMLLGMALYKARIITGEASDSLYRRLVMLGAFGLAVSTWGVHQNFENGFSVEYSMFMGGIPNYWGSIAAALGYIGLVMLAVRRQLFPGLQERLAAVGRMAFTNYIAHSVIAWIVFNQLGFFGAMPRWQHPLIVLAIWMLQLWYSPHWLARFRYGPLEWMWRSATYGRIGPLARP